MSHRIRTGANSWNYNSPDKGSQFILSTLSWGLKTPISDKSHVEKHHSSNIFQKVSLTPSEKLWKRRCFDDVNICQEGAVRDIIFCVVIYANVMKYESGFLFQEIKYLKQ